MRTIMAFGFTALLALLAIGVWSGATTHSVNRRRGLRRVEQADQPARADEELDGANASAIRRELTSRIPSNLPGRALGSHRCFEQRPFRSLPLLWQISDPR